MKGVCLYIVAVVTAMSLNFTTVHAQAIGERGCDSAKAYTYSDIAYESSSIDTTLKYGILSLQYCCERDTEIISRNYHNIGWAYHNLARDKEALPYMQTAVKYAKMMNDSAGLCSSYNLLAEVYNYLDLIDSTFYYLNMSLGIALRIKDTLLLSDCYNMMGSASHNGDFKQAAQDYYCQAAHLDSISGNLMGLAFNLIRCSQRLVSIFTSRYAFTNKNNPTTQMILPAFISHTAKWLMLIYLQPSTLAKRRLPIRV